MRNRFWGLDGDEEAEGEQCQGDGQPRKALHQKETGGSGPNQYQTKRSCLRRNPPRADGWPQTEDQAKSTISPPLCNCSMLSVNRELAADDSLAERIKTVGLSAG